ncbi:hypothetical protein F5148DRAFT_1286680 [Russula earlei]|uniref:Uncharacterized protein n=1 Tax=Russula earlei TaxID=71964 RepID=A0ACC0U4D0_9AGAM|nr:hypothetical protein F5148DRAFT_1286680 [Russula earlei]
MSSGHRNVPRHRTVYPWSLHRLPPGPLPSPFPRYGHALPATATAAGELFLFGGLVHESARNDLFVFSTRDLSATLLQTSGEIPSPRVGHAAALVGDILLIWGGDMSTRGQEAPEPQDDSLYLLNLASREWTRVMINGTRPVSRYGHTVTMVGSKLFVFGGQVVGEFLNDMWAFDLNSLKSEPVWESYEPPAGNEKPPRRSGHVSVTRGDRIVIFGGTDGRHHYNDTWLFDVPRRKWRELRCSGYIPSPREGHAAALVDDAMYVFGGRGVDGTDLGDLTAFKLSIQKWFKFPNIGPSPSGRSGHAMASNGSRVFVLGGESSIGAQSTFIHVLDTRRIKYPKPHANAVNFGGNIQPARKSSPDLSTQVDPEQPTPPSRGTNATRPASPFRLVVNSESTVFHQNVSAQRVDLRTLPLPPTGGSGRSGFVSGHDDDGEASTQPAVPESALLPNKESAPSPPAHGGTPTSAIQEAAYYRAMFAALEEASEGDVAWLQGEGLVELEQRSSRTLAALAGRVAQLSEELAVKSALLDKAEANAAQATKRAELLETHVRVLRERDVHKRHAATELREYVDRLLAQAAQRDAELLDVQARLDELLLSRDQYVRAPEQAQSTLQKATSRAAEVGEQNWKYEMELSGLRGQPEASSSAVRDLLSAADMDEPPHPHHDPEMAECRTIHEHPERVQALEVEVMSLRAMLRDMTNLLEETRGEPENERRKTSESVIFTDDASVDMKEGVPETNY